METRFSNFTAAILFASSLLISTMSAVADEAYDAAQAEMKKALGALPEFIALLPKGAQPGAWELSRASRETRRDRYTRSIGN